MDKKIPLILLVDDDADTCEVMQMALNMDGFSTRVAYSGEQAIALLSQRKPDVIVLDYMLKGNLGASDFVAIARSRKIDTPTVLLSGVGNPKEKARLLQIEHALQRPCDIDELLKLLRKLTDASVLAT